MTLLLLLNLCPSFTFCSPVQLQSFPRFLPLRSFPSSPPIGDVADGRFPFPPLCSSSLPAASTASLLFPTPPAAGRSSFLMDAHWISFPLEHNLFCNIMDYGDCSGLCLPLCTLYSLCFQPVQSAGYGKDSLAPLLSD